MIDYKLNVEIWKHIISQKKKLRFLTHENKKLMFSTNENKKEGKR
jgi:hypothetical protein